MPSPSLPSPISHSAERLVARRQRQTNCAKRTSTEPRPQSMPSPISHSAERLVARRQRSKQTAQSELLRRPYRNLCRRPCRTPLRSRCSAAATEQANCAKRTSTKSRPQSMPSPTSHDSAEPAVLGDRASQLRKANFYGAQIEIYAWRLRTGRLGRVQRRANRKLANGMAPLQRPPWTRAVTVPHSRSGSGVINLFAQGARLLSAERLPKRVLN